MVNEGEVLGIAGVSGDRSNTNWGQVLEGTLKPDRGGRVMLGEKDISFSTPDQISHAGVGRIPEDRHAGLVGELSVAENWPSKISRILLRMVCWIETKS